ncbi:hypothetical protein HPB49_017267 [Dermacentor silvarum]|uniref:Uncharacterized protein n=1 Tax=Dermacentor silvarum TaxID=543639 RepID=A0ACB8E1F2_DERSI|nr:hypothetical protein HPB49_017267 [Dermacentor silvarum]
MGRSSSDNKRVKLRGVAKERDHRQRNEHITHEMVEITDVATSAQKVADLAQDPQQRCEESPCVTSQQGDVITSPANNDMVFDRNMQGLSYPEETCSMDAEVELSELDSRTCRTLFRLQRNRIPVILLQEMDAPPTLQLTGYNKYLQPCIPRKLKGRHVGSDLTARGLAGVFVDKRFRQVQIDTQDLCTPHREIVLVAMTLANFRLRVDSVYIRPGCQPGDDMSWVSSLKQRCPTRHIIIAGDLNVPHTQWGYPIHTPRDRALIDAMEKSDFNIANVLGLYTRVTLHAGQQDSTPDLTWTSQDLRLRWQRQENRDGSDHHPILLSIENISRTCTKTRTTYTTNRDRFRKLYVDDTGSFLDRLKIAKQRATKVTRARWKDPAPDLHMLNLIASRLRAQQQAKRHPKNV